MGAYKNAILSDSPRAFWILGESSGTNAADSSGNGFNATYTGSNTLGRPALLVSETDLAVGTNGTSSYVAAPAGLSTAGLTAMTVICWLRWSSAVAADSRVVDNSHTDADNNGFELVLNTSAKTGSFVVGDGVGSDFLGVSALGITTNTPIMYAAKLGGGAYSIWLNGVKVANGTSSRTLNNGAGPINMGRGNYNNDYYSGVIGMVAIFNTALSDARIYQYYSLGKALGLLAGTAQGNGAATGGIQVSHRLGGTAQGNGAANGGLQVVKRLGGTAQGNGAAVGMVAIKRALAGVAQGDGRASGGLFIPPRPGAVAISDAALSLVTLTDRQVA